MEFVFSIVIISLISIALMKLTLSLHRQHVAKSSHTLAQLSIANAADIVRNYLEAESSFTFIDSALQFSGHSITLQDSTLLLDGVTLAQDITSFRVKSLTSASGGSSSSGGAGGVNPLGAQAFSIDLCASFAHAKAPLCINRVGWLRQ